MNAALENLKLIEENIHMWESEETILPTTEIFARVREYLIRSGENPVIGVSPNGHLVLTLKTGEYTKVLRFSDKGTSETIVKHEG